MPKSKHEKFMDLTDKRHAPSGTVDEMPRRSRIRNLLQGGQYGLLPMLPSVVSSVTQTPPKHEGYNINMVRPMTQEQEDTQLAANRQLLEAQGPLEQPTAAHQAAPTPDFSGAKVVFEGGGQKAFQVLQDPSTGKLYFLPGFGPEAANPLEVSPQDLISGDLLNFSSGE
jgi:hypothetical protein